MVERCRRYRPDKIGHADRRRDRQTDKLIPIYRPPVFIRGVGVGCYKKNEGKKEYSEVSTKSRTYSWVRSCAHACVCVYMQRLSRKLRSKLDNLVHWDSPSILRLTWANRRAAQVFHSGWDRKQRQWYTQWRTMATWSPLYLDQYPLSPSPLPSSPTPDEKPSIHFLMFCTTFFLVLLTVPSRASFLKCISSCVRYPVLFKTNKNTTTN